MVKFYKDSEKNILAALNGRTLELNEVKVGEVNAAVEKHVPVVEIKDNKVLVTVGEVSHPMIDAHYIEWIAVETNKGISFKYLNPNEEPKTEFVLLEGEELVKTYAYCNLHGLWAK